MSRWMYDFFFKPLLRAPNTHCVRQSISDPGPAQIHKHKQSPEGSSKKERNPLGIILCRIHRTIRSSCIAFSIL